MTPSEQGLAAWEIEESYTVKRWGKIPSKLSFEAGSGQDRLLRGPATMLGRNVPRGALLGVLAFLTVSFLALANDATANTQRPFKETFGSAAQPTLNPEDHASTVTVELRSGDVLVGVAALVAAGQDGLEGSVRRYHADGTPAPFPKLGTNVIDGTEEGGEPCAVQPASCDETGHGGLGLSPTTQIAIDESGGVSDGDIYVSEQLGQDGKEFWIDIFAADGEYLGELTGPSAESKFYEIRGIAAAEDGALFVSEDKYITKFIPTKNPTVNSDVALRFLRSPSDTDGLRNIISGAGPSAGSIFVLADKREGETQIPSILQFDSATGEFERSLAEGQADSGVEAKISVDPNTGAILMSNKNLTILEFEAARGTESKRIGGIRANGLPGLAVNGDSEVILGGGEKGSVYGRPRPVATVTVEPPEEVTGTRAVVIGTVNPEGVPLSECFFEYGSVSMGRLGEEPCEGTLPPTDSSPHRVQAEIKGLESNGSTYYFRLVIVDANGTEESADETLTTASTVVTEPANSISTNSATLNGLLRPENEQYSACFFEFGLATSARFERRLPCTPRAGEVPQSLSPQLVKAPVTGLRIATTYRYKLVATSPRGTLEGEELTFSTQGAPRVSGVAASGADQTSATLEGMVNPSGFNTSYRIEWGPTSAYGRLVPLEFEPYLGAGETPIRVTGRITGLSAGMTYHYRIVATSFAGTTFSTDHILETLNSCGLPEGRCFELVSRADAGPVAIPGIVGATSELHYQVDPAGGAVTYPVEFGYPEARRGFEVAYRARRDISSWRSTELSPPLISQSQRTETGSEVGQIQWLSDDLSCGFLQTSQPLTNEPSMRLVLEHGGQNYLRENPDGSFTSVTNLAPENPEVADGGLEYTFIGASQDCTKVIFRTPYRYPGVPAAPVFENRPYYTYEWDNGKLRGVEPSERTPLDRENVMSEDGSRFFFQQGTMLDHGVTREYATTQTELPSASANVQYQWANRDGSRVFFTADAGLTTEASGESTSEGTDLYEFNVNREELIDRTVVRTAGGAQVAGFVAATEDGSTLYFGSRAQLLPGRGPTLAQNVAANTYSVYEESSGGMKYVGAAAGAGGLFVQDPSIGLGSSSWTSQISADGRYLIFQSKSDLTEYKSGRSYELYLFDRSAGLEGNIICVSCRPDGLPSITPTSYPLLLVGGVLGNEFHRPQFLVVRGEKPEVFFTSPDALAPDAVAGQNNIYEWTHEQVFRLTGAPAGSQVQPFAGRNVIFAGASADGSDVYLTSPENLSSEDPDARNSVFDARFDGGFPAPPTEPAPCRAGIENSCQGPGRPPETDVGAASAVDAGAQNLGPKRKRCAKHRRCAKKRQHRARKKLGHGRRNAGRAREHGKAGK